MFVPKYYRNDNIDEVKEFISENGFGILISQNYSKLWGTHIPLVLEKDENGKDVLRGHISKGNPQWKYFKDNTNVLVIFPGPHTYISSSWYDHINVPTWNYIAVHVYGAIRIIEGEKLINSLKNLMEKYEKYSDKPVKIEDMPEKFLHDHINGIVAFEVEIEEIQPAYKLSQNRDDFNHSNIINELRKRKDQNSHKIADEMEKHSKKLPDK